MSKNVIIYKNNSIRDKNYNIKNYELKKIVIRIKCNNELRTKISYKY